MTDFRFNFSIESESSNKLNNEISEKENDNKMRTENKERAQEIFYDENEMKNVESVFEHGNMFVCGDIEIGYVKHEDVCLQFTNDSKDEDKSNNLLLAENAQSDLVEDKYEGGLKVWECTADLANYIINNESVKFTNCNVLDLGCGMGILGIMALLKGAFVHFQDYNVEVIKNATIPNIVLNTDTAFNIKERCKFFAGDWEMLNDLMGNKYSDFKYDLILSAETIYNPKNYGKIYQLIKNHLSISGIALLSAKSYYFGVGGSTKAFTDWIKKDNKMDCELCWKNESGVSREILKISHKT